MFGKTASNTTGPQPRQASSSCMLDNKMYMFGGDAGGNHKKNDLWAYDPESGLWSEEIAYGEPPSKRWQQSLCAVGSCLVVFAGFASQYENDVYIYDTVTKRWSGKVAATNPPDSRSGHTAVAYNGSMITYGGYNLRYHGDTNAFDLATKTWQVLTCKGNGPSPRFGHCATFSKHYNSMIVHGGEDPQQNFLNDVFMLNMETLEWQEIKARGVLPPRGILHTGCSYQNFLVVYGGTNDSETYGQTRGVFVLDFDLLEWECQKVVAPTTTLCDHVAEVVNSGSMVVFGGRQMRHGRTVDAPIHEIKLNLKQWMVPQDMLDIWQASVVSDCTVRDNFTRMPISVHKCVLATRLSFC